ncbi:MAG: quinohemoprotein amine dehydrogenase subunit alpha [Burkholderiales bacterium]
MTARVHHRARRRGAIMLRVLMPGVFAATVAMASAAAWAGVAPAQLMAQKCGACHQQKGTAFERITDIRKSPEGWDMTLARMAIWHKVDISRSERKALVKYLADTQGLAPEESAPYRFLIERRPNVEDVVPSEELGRMCTGCHSFGRVALQRRNVDEWRKLVQTHVGQFPSVEYSGQARTVSWLDLAMGEVAPKLAKLYPLRTKAWTQWQRVKHLAPSGTWRVVGERPGWGAYSGYMFVTALGADRYGVKYEMQYDSGNRVSGEGEASLYTGYEWRGTATLGNQATHSIFALSQDGREISGRWYLRGADEVGARFEAVRMDAASRGAILALSPAFVKTGETTTVRVSGVKLGASYDPGPGIKIDKVVRVSADEVDLVVTVAQGAAIGWRTLKQGTSGQDAKIALYRQIDSLRVEPAFAIARLGGGGGANPPVSAQFEAIAYIDGPDGKPGTDDDIRLGPVSAQWRVENYSERAKAANDAKFAGVMQPDGQFLPAQAGPNPARANHGNNIGNLSVVATLTDGPRRITSRGHLVVTVQSWNRPPLR